MIRFRKPILKFGKKGEKTGWTYAEVTADIAGQIKPGIKKSFRVKGKLDDYVIESTALIPMGKGNFILPINAQMRRGTGKKQGEEILLELEADNSPVIYDTDLIECLEDEPAAKNFFYTLPKSHQNYYSKWITSAKTFETKSKRLAQCINALLEKQNYGEMMRSNKKKNN